MIVPSWAYHTEAPAGGKETGNGPTANGGHVLVLPGDPGFSGLGRAGAPGQGHGGPEGRDATSEALKLLNEYVDRYPQMGEARYYRALALNGLGRQKEALEDVDEALADNPGNVSCSPAQGEPPGGPGSAAGGHLDLIPRPCKCDPRNAEACKERGECLAQEGQFAEAMADLNRAAGLAPRDPWVFNKRGMVWFCQGEYQKAVDDFTTAIRLAPGPGHLLFLPGQHLPVSPEGAGEGHRRL